MRAALGAAALAAAAVLAGTDAALATSDTTFGGPLDTVENIVGGSSGQLAAALAVGAALVGSVLRFNAMQLMGAIGAWVETETARMAGRDKASAFYPTGIAADRQRLQRAERPPDHGGARAPVHDPRPASVRAHPQAEPRRRAVPQHGLASVRRREGARTRHRDLRSVPHGPIPPVRFGRDRRVAGAPVGEHPGHAG